MLSCVKSVIPVRIKRYVRERVIEPALRARNARELRRLIAILRDHGECDRDFLEHLRRAWGNEAFSADVTYLQETVRRVKHCDGPVLECGSGLTTVLAGVLAEKSGATVWSLEQDEQWRQYVERALALHDVKRVKVIYRPLRRYDDFVWYDVGSLELPKRFPLILCDGPFIFEQWGEPFYSSWRYGVLPILARRSIATGEVLLDDAEEPRASRLLHRWDTEFGMRHDLIRSVDGACAVFTSAAAVESPARARPGLA